MFDDDVMKPPSAFKRLCRTKLPLWVVLLLLAVSVTAAYHGTRILTERQLRPQLDTPAQQSDIDSAQQRELLRRQNEELQLVFGTALAWAVRAAMMRNNVDQVEQYFDELAKTPSIQLTVLADRNGKVLVSSNRRLRGERFSAHFPQRLLNAQEAMLERVGEKEVRLTLPIQGFTKRLGTVMLVYAAP
jgi:C4-dicarboxylate-specific signal transduction histidine kinase